MNTNQTQQKPFSRENNQVSVGAPQCGHPDSEPFPWENNYRFIRELGHGAQGHVYLAERLSDQKRVAIKQLDIESVKSWKSYELFRREGDVLRTLDIPGVAKCYETVECLDDNPPCAYIVQEYIEGKSLQAFMNEGRRFRLDLVYDIAIQILDILSALQHHDPPIIHRDVKPSNLIISVTRTYQYQVSLIDFGAVSNPQIQGGGSTVAGTFGYMAPELLMGKPEPASDIYSLGAVLVYMLSGMSPAEMPVKDFHLLFEPYLQFLNPNVVSVLRGMLEPDVAHRMTDIALLKEQFSNFSYSGPVLVNDKIAAPLGAEYDNSLQSVQSYGQEGNIELWQRLPDTVPRAIPDCYLKLTFNLEKLEYKDAVVKNYIRIGDILLFIFAPILVMLALNYIPLLGPLLGWLLWGGIQWIVEKLDVATSLNNFVMYLLVYVFILLICLVVWRTLRRGKNIKISEQMDQIALFKANEHKEGFSAYNRYKMDLIKNGRKTIARIVNIQYVPVMPELVKTSTQLNDSFGIIISTDDNNNGLNPESYKNRFAVSYDAPTFRVQYSFNPPDDLREFDIVHYFDTHEDPTEFLHVGDALPILYKIERRSSGKEIKPDKDGIFRKHRFGEEEIVSSMPFPFPLGDPLSGKDIIVASRAY